MASEDEECGTTTTQAPATTASGANAPSVGGRVGPAPHAGFRIVIGGRASSAATG